jgi:hypothetical protein
VLPRQPRNRATAQPRNRANSGGNSFAVRQLFFRRRPGFDNDCPDAATPRPVFKTRRPASKTFRPAFVNGCPGFDRRRPGFQSRCPELVNGRPEFFGHCPGFQTLAPFLKVVAPIAGTPRLFYNLLPQSNLRELPQKNTQNARKNQPFSFGIGMVCHKRNAEHCPAWKSEGRFEPSHARRSKRYDYLPFVFYAFSCGQFFNFQPAILNPQPT